MKESNTEERPLELLAAMSYRFTDSLAAHLGGGPGITRGYGTPGFRLFAGVIWTEAERPSPLAPSRPRPPRCVRMAPRTWTASRTTTAARIRTMTATASST